MRGFVDRIHEGIATLLLGDDESISLTVPVSWLPDGVCEGKVLQFDIHIDQTVTNSGKQQMQSLLESLGNEP